MFVFLHYIFAPKLEEVYREFYGSPRLDQKGGQRRENVFVIQGVLLPVQTVFFKT